jgi:ribosomal protein L11 methyltransferase
VSWIEFTIAAPAAGEEELAAALIAAGATGVSVEPAAGGGRESRSGSSPIAPEDWDAILLRAFFDAGTSRPGEAEIAALIRETPGAGGSARILSVASVEEGRWVERWIAALAPFDVGTRFTIVPVADLDHPDGARRDSKAAPRGSGRDPRAPAISGVRIEIRICPARAFGTGEHATTRLCLEALERVPLRGRSLLDAGTGSGILAIAGVKLGCARVMAFDNDPEAVEVARKNAALNDSAAAITFVRAEAGELRGETYDVITANLNGTILERVLPSLASRLASGGALVLSGILESEADTIAAQVRSLVPSQVRIERRDGWACLACGDDRA